jgi:RNase P subunit RPR2
MFPVTGWNIPTKYHQGSVACPKCFKMFTKSNNMKVHFRDAHGTSEPIQCPLCEVIAKNPTSMRMHMHRRHRKK